jgi:hypothetical protein
VQNSVFGIVPLEWMYDPVTHTINSGRAVWLPNCVLLCDNVRCHLNPNLPFKQISSEHKQRMIDGFETSISMLCTNDTTPPNQNRRVGFAIVVLRHMTLPELRAAMPPAPSEHACVGRARRMFDSGDGDVQTDSIAVSMIDPVSRTRIQTPARCPSCTGMDVFDVDQCLQLAIQSKNPSNFKCPLCNKVTTVRHIVRDTFLERLFAAHTGPSTSIELTPDALPNPPTV